jgi:hypothetical protein
MGGNASLSEQDFKDLLDLQDGVASCKSFHPQNRVQDEGKCGVLRAGGVFLCGFASEKMPTAPIERACGACLRSREAAKRECFGCFAGLLSALGGGIEMPFSSQ